MLVFRSRYMPSLYENVFTAHITLVITSAGKWTIAFVASCDLLALFCCCNISQCFRVFNILYGTDIVRSIFLQNPITDIPYITSEGNVCVCPMNTNSDWCFASVTSEPNAIYYLDRAIMAPNCTYTIVSTASLIIRPHSNQLNLDMDRMKNRVKYISKRHIRNYQVAYNTLWVHCVYLTCIMRFIYVLHGIFVAVASGSQTNDLIKCWFILRSRNEANLFNTSLGWSVNGFPSSQSVVP